MTEIDIDVDIRAALRDIDHMKRDTDTAGKRAVSALVTLAESFMKSEAPEGAGKSPPSLRGSVTSTPSHPSKRKRVYPSKKTREGWLLVRAVVDSPTYTDEKPPVEPLMEWARAKLGDRSAAWGVRENIFQEGQATFPNRFVDRSLRQWSNEAEEVAGDAVREALR